MKRLRQFLTYRLSRDLWTYQNGALLVMALHGLSQLQAGPEGSQAVRDVQQFYRGWLSWEVLFGSMIVLGVGGLFRLWTPAQLMILHIPYFLFLSAVGWLTAFDPIPQRPPQRFLSFVDNIILIHCFMMSMTNIRFRFTLLWTRHER